MLPRIAPVPLPSPNCTLLALLASLAFGLFVPSWSSAQGRDPAPLDDEAMQTAAARGLFEQGMEAVDAGDYSTAADRLSRSLAIRDSVVARANLGIVLVELGRLVEASEHFRAVMRAADVGSPPYELAERSYAEIATRLGRLQIEISGEEEALEVQLDGRVVDEALIGVPQPADAGTHRVSLHRLGRELAHEVVLVELHVLAHARLEAPPLTDEEIDQLEEMESGAVDVVLVQAPGGGVQDEWWFWTLIGALVVGAGVGVALGIVLNPTITYQDGSSDNFHHTALIEVEF